MKNMSISDTVSNKSSLSDPSVPILSGSEEGRETKGNPSKFDFDLYHEDLDVAMPSFRVKRIALPNDGERWRIMSGSLVICVVEGSKLNKKERAFLRSLDGVNFLLGLAKKGAGSFNAVKIALKNHLKQTR